MKEISHAHLIVGEMLIFSTKKVASVFETRPSSFLSMARRPLENILQLFSKFLRENVNSLGDDWLCEVQKLLEINFLVDVTVKVEISTSCNTISRIFLKCHTLKLILKNINKQASLMRPRRALNMKVTNNANAKK